MTLGELLSSVKLLAKISQLGWLDTPTNSLSSLLFELSIEWKVDQEDSWMKITSKKNCVDNQIIFLNILWKDLEVFKNHK